MSPQPVKRLIAEAQPWMAEAACSGMDPNLFFPVRGESTEAARAVCETCAVRSDCLNYAVETREALGIWGGTSERQRRKHHVGARSAVARNVEPCGTDAAYARHRRNGETPCEPCRIAHNVRQADYRRRRSA